MGDEDDPDGAPDPQRKAVTTAATWLAGSVTIAAAFAAWIGVSGSDLNRIVRNEPWWFIPSAVALLFAIVAGVVAGLTRHQNVAVIVGVFFFGVALATLTVAKAQATARQERPTVEASLVAGTQPRVEVHLSARGLAISEYVYVQVLGMNASGPLDANRPVFFPHIAPRPPNNFFTQPLYVSRVGPSPSGEAKATLAIDLARGLYDRVQVVAEIFHTAPSNPEGPTSVENPQQLACNARSQTVACVTLMMPTPADPHPVVALQSEFDACFGPVYKRAAARHQSLDEAHLAVLAEPCLTSVNASARPTP